jgi:hypothetical protein
MGNSSKTKRAHRRQRRSKRLLLLVVVLIAAGQIAAGLLLDLDPLKVRFRPAESIISDLGKISHHPDILFLGSSRLQGDIRIEELQKAMQETFGKEIPLMVNCSFPDGDPYAMDFLLQHLLSCGIAPRMVVIEISPETVMLGGAFFGGQVTRILTLKEMPDAAPDLVAFGKIQELLSSRATPIYTFRKEILTYLFGLPPPYLALQTGARQPPVTNVNPQNNPGEGKENILTRIRSSRPKVQSWLRGFRIQGLYPRHLESMLAYFKANGIAAILVGVPVTTTHFECYSDGINEKFLYYMNTLVRTYGCRFVDYRNRFPDDLFNDHHHMSLEGAGEFSRLFGEEVLSEAWRKVSNLHSVERFAR